LPYLLDFARIWQAADKVVYSRTLKSASTARTRIEKDFDPEAVRRMKAETERDLLVGGADLVGQAVEAGVVDELHLFPAPIVVGGGSSPTTSLWSSSCWTNAGSRAAGGRRTAGGTGVP
jgi:dihydrofolate reductase